MIYLLNFNIIVFNNELNKQMIEVDRRIVFFVETIALLLILLVILYKIFSNKKERK